MQLSHVVIIALLLLGTSSCGFAEQASSERAKTSTDAGWIRLFDGKSLDGWHTYSAKAQKE